MELTKKEKARVSRFKRRLADAPTGDVKYWADANNASIYINPLEFNFEEACEAQRRADAVYVAHIKPLAQAELDRRHI